MRRNLLILAAHLPVLFVLAVVISGVRVSAAPSLDAELRGTLAEPGVTMIGCRP